MQRFNSRSRVGSDLIEPLAVGAGFVSIRAPAWGATRYAKPAFANGKVSIRAPAWGATLTTITLAIDTGFQFALPRGERRLHAARPRHSLRFNSRSRVGSDIERRTVGTRKAVSIRAPAWGATTARHPLDAGQVFQFALPRGERPKSSAFSTTRVGFQLALPRGERHSANQR